MRWRDDLDQWHRVFCWVPYLIDGTWAWLEHVERRRTSVSLYDDIFEYRLPALATPTPTEKGEK